MQFYGIQVKKCWMRPILGLVFYTVFLPSFYLERLGTKPVFFSFLAVRVPYFVSILPVRCTHVRWGRHFHGYNDLKDL